MEANSTVEVFSNIGTTDIDTLGVIGAPNSTTLQNIIQEETDTSVNIFTETGTDKTSGELTIISNVEIADPFSQSDIIESNRVNLILNDSKTFSVSSEIVDHIYDPCVLTGYLIPEPFDSSNDIEVISVVENKFKQPNCKFNHKVTKPKTNKCETVPNKFISNDNSVQFESKKDENIVCSSLSVASSENSENLCSTETQIIEELHIPIEATESSDSNGYSIITSFHDPTNRINVTGESKDGGGPTISSCESSIKCDDGCLYPACKHNPQKEKTSELIIVDSNHPVNGEDAQCQALPIDVTDGYNVAIKISKATDTMTKSSTPTNTTTLKRSYELTETSENSEHETIEILNNSSNAVISSDKTSLLSTKHYSDDILFAGDFTATPRLQASLRCETATDQCHYCEDDITGTGHVATILQHSDDIQSSKECILSHENILHGEVSTTVPVRDDSSPCIPLGSELLVDSKDKLGLESFGQLSTQFFLYEDNDNALSRCNELETTKNVLLDINNHQSHDDAKSHIDKCSPCIDASQNVTEICFENNDLHLDLRFDDKSNFESTAKDLLIISGREIIKEGSIGSEEINVPEEIIISNESIGDNVSAVNQNSQQFENLTDDRTKETLEIPKNVKKSSVCEPLDDSFTSQNSASMLGKMDPTFESSKSSVANSNAAGISNTKQQISGSLMMQVAIVELLPENEEFETLYHFDCSETEHDSAFDAKLFKIHENLSNDTVSSCSINSIPDVCVTADNSSLTNSTTTVLPKMQKSNTTTENIFQSNGQEVYSPSHDSKCAPESRNNSQTQFSNETNRTKYPKSKWLKSKWFSRSRYLYKGISMPHLSKISGLSPSTCRAEKKNPVSILSINPIFEVESNSDDNSIHSSCDTIRGSDATGSQSSTGSSTIDIASSCSSSSSALSSQPDFATARNKLSTIIIPRTPSQQDTSRLQSSEHMASYPPVTSVCATMAESMTGYSSTSSGDSNDQLDDTREILLPDMQCIRCCVSEEVYRQPDLFCHCHSNINNESSDYVELCDTCKKEKIESSYGYLCDNCIEKVPKGRSASVGSRTLKFVNSLSLHSSLPNLISDENLPSNESVKFWVDPGGNFICCHSDLINLHSSEIEELEKLSRSTVQGLGAKAGVTWDDIIPLCLRQYTDFDSSMAETDSVCSHVEENTCSKEDLQDNIISQRNNSLTVSVDNEGKSSLHNVSPSTASNNAANDGSDVSRKYKTPTNIKRRMATTRRRNKSIIFPEAEMVSKCSRVKQLQHHPERRASIANIAVSGLSKFPEFFNHVFKHNNTKTSSSKECILHEDNRKEEKGHNSPKESESALNGNTEENICDSENSKVGDDVDCSASSVIADLAEELR